MSDLQEMTTDFARACELGDFEAAERIMFDIRSEAAKFNFGDMAEELEDALRNRGAGRAIAIAVALGAKGAQMDAANNQWLGDGFFLAHGAADYAFAAARR